MDRELALLIVTVFERLVQTERFQIEAMKMSLARFDVLEAEMQVHRAMLTISDETERKRSLSAQLDALDAEVAAEKQRRLDRLHDLLAQRESGHEQLEALLDALRKSLSEPSDEE